MVHNRAGLFNLRLDNGSVAIQVVFTSMHRMNRMLAMPEPHSACGDVRGYGAVIKINQIQFILCIDVNFLVRRMAT